MALEIERKFLVTSNSWQNKTSHSVIRQGYLSRDIERTVRVRVKNDKAYLTIKGRNTDAIRTEFEYEIPKTDGEALLDTLALKPLIEKTRTTIEYAGKIWEIDCFFGDNKGLVVAEVELSCENEQIELPEWVGREVTSFPRYYNSALSERPYSQWSDDEKAGR